MPTVKIRDVMPECRDPDHYPTTNQVFSPGEYEHTCPSCGYKVRFAVPAIYSDGSKHYPTTHLAPPSPPEPPPLREFIETFFGGFRQTKESIERSRKWKERNLR